MNNSAESVGVWSPNPYTGFVLGDRDLISVAENLLLQKLARVGEEKVFQQ